MGTCLVIQHVPPESAWVAGDALVRSGVVLDVCRTFAGDEAPAGASGHEGVVVMGGPMSASSDEDFPTRAAELALLADALALGVPTLGICLGAQLVALAAGGRVHRGESGPEIGWDPVELTPAGRSDPLFAGLSAHLTVMHWHGDTFTLRCGACRLAGNERYSNQAFRAGPAAWGIQFHLEVTQPAVEGFLAAFASDLGPGQAERMADVTPGALGALLPWRDLLLGRFAALVSEHARRGGSPPHFARTFEA